MKLNIKQKFAGAKDFAKKHQNAILGTVLVAGTTAIVVLFYKNHKIALARRSELEASGKKFSKFLGTAKPLKAPARFGTS